jgi:isoamyl acetate esterase
LPGTTGQHVPLDIYRANLKQIATHATIQRQGPRLILVTPPPIDENKLEAHLLTNGIHIPTRTVEQTKTYADVTREVGLELGLAVLDLWSIFMNHAGWREGQPLAGSKRAPENRLLQALLRDGMYSTYIPNQISEHFPYD